MQGRRESRSTQQSSDFHGRGLVPHLVVDALHHRLELLLRPALIELGNAVLDHLLNEGGPKNGAGELPLQEAENDFRLSSRWQRLACDVHVDVAGGGAHLRKSLVQSLLELLLCRLHQGGVEGPSGLQQLRLEGTLLLCDVLQLVDGLLRASAGEAFREERVGDLADCPSTLLLLCLSAALLQDLLVQSRHREHRLLPDLCGLLHSLAPELHQS
mmetsp:Transcript_49145/g.114694  ORF Transcript_49145/g.114694 Transcript_49145/m.114694 type:complete len:214 (-) Transcript_49145:960-1601(-)